jgi:Ca2+-binding RTX toxin-like protein
MSIVYGNSNSILHGGAVFNAPEKIMVSPVGFILNIDDDDASGDALVLNNGSYVVKIDGLVAAGGHIGVHYTDGTGSSNLFVGNSGGLFGGETAVSASQKLNIVNSGQIGGDCGVKEEANGNYSIRNNRDGQIGGGDNGAIVLQGAGVHKIVNKGSFIVFSPSFTINSTGAGKEIVTNSGSIEGDVFLGLGNDVFTNKGKGTADNVHLGGGNDKFFGGSAIDHVFDSSGSDAIRLGAGADVYNAIRGMAIDTGADGTDKVDGGKGIDVYNASAATVSLLINLDRNAQTDTSVAMTIAAKTATDLGAGEIGTDKLTKIEIVQGGAGSDIIFGSQSVDQLFGNGEDDHLFGLGGNDRLDGGALNDRLFGGVGADTLVGGTGSDHLTGGKGKDILYGGDGTDTPDNAADYFVFTGIGESTVSRGGRDVILDFEDTIDQIDLSALGHLDFIGMFSPFTGTGPEVRVSAEPSGWVVQVDRNGDTKMDFAIEIRDFEHAIEWDTTDFLLS